MAFLNNGEHVSSCEAEEKDNASCVLQQEPRTSFIILSNYVPVWSPSRRSVWPTHAVSVRNEKNIEKENMRRRGCRFAGPLSKQILNFQINGKQKWKRYCPILFHGHSFTVFKIWYKFAISLVVWYNNINFYRGGSQSIIVYWSFSNFAQVNVGVKNIKKQIYWNAIFLSAHAR